MWSSSRLQSFLSMKTLSRVLHIPCACMSAAPVFNPKKILILTKLSRYDFERRLHPKLTEEELKSSLYARGSDYYMLLHYHNVHKSVEQAVVQAFDEAGIETKVVNRLQYCDALISWADAVVTTGGDGTYLLAASRIYTRNKPVIGFNSDPTRSKGQLCLPEKYSANPRYAVNQLLKGMFRWQYRTRIRVTLRGKDIYRSPIELHDQQLLNPEYRYLDIDSNLKADQLRHTVSEWDRSDPSLPTRTLPVLALNEVFIGECISARVSYLEMQFDDQAPVKHKCSGLIVCTGTGSTSWTFNVNKLTEQNLEQALLILEEVTGNPKSFSHPSLVAKVADKFNNLLVTDAEDNRLVYTIRDQLVTPIPRHVPHQHFGMADARTSPLPVEGKSSSDADRNFSSSERVSDHIAPLPSDPSYHAYQAYRQDVSSAKTRGFAQEIYVKSRCFDAALVIDGGMSFHFNDGTRALLQIHPDDALTNVVLHDTDSISYKH